MSQDGTGKPPYRGVWDTRCDTQTPPRGPLTATLRADPRHPVTVGAPVSSGRILRSDARPTHGGSRSGITAVADLAGAEAGAHRQPRSGQSPLARSRLAGTPAGQRLRPVFRATAEA